jgi:Protein of unknown function (DUF2946)
MRRRLEKFLPIVLIALMVQILAPIGACWAAALAASDPLTAAEICYTDPGQGSGAGDQSGQHHAHDGACAICCAAQASAALETPQPTIIAAPYRDAAAVVWHQQAEDLRLSRVGSNTQARAPPFIS